MIAVTIEEAQAKLPELIRNLGAGDEVVLTESDQPVARLVATPVKAPCQRGALKRTVTYVAPDFDAPLEDFTESMW